MGVNEKKLYKCRMGIPDFDLPLETVQAKEYIKNSKPLKNPVLQNINKEYQIKSYENILPKNEFQIEQNQDKQEKKILCQKNNTNIKLDHLTSKNYSEISSQRDIQNSFSIDDNSVLNDFMKYKKPKIDKQVSYKIQQKKNENENSINDNEIQNQQNNIKEQQNQGNISCISLNKDQQSESNQIEESQQTNNLQFSEASSIQAFQERMKYKSNIQNPILQNNENVEEEKFSNIQQNLNQNIKLKSIIEIQNKNNSQELINQESLKQNQENIESSNNIDKRKNEKNQNMPQSEFQKTSQQRGKEKDNNQQNQNQCQNKKQLKNDSIKLKKTNLGFNNQIKTDYQKQNENKNSLDKKDQISKIQKQKYLKAQRTLGDSTSEDEQSQSYLRSIDNMDKYDQEDSQLYLKFLKKQFQKQNRQINQKIKKDGEKDQNKIFSAENLEKSIQDISRSFQKEDQIYKNQKIKKLVEKFKQEEKLKKLSQNQKNSDKKIKLHQNKINSQQVNNEDKEMQPIISLKLNIKNQQQSLNQTRYR
ncbi:hypothetical protein PPERSA_02159 [Pseudocohnilembus persalinus]|uniref:Uncharacterized protein n=1 Tax=Pseudocohnilembus persalinus TaxID=266149 RepID=A0A0V0Q7N0_PSEPJ|nr:hypothetical protein PPERSA_02159 [Pseudocohnilembus persalinus]|eukprot:KRW98181.1 hypothetical protein PPERSA_02159 [Pseudocohnilembus persalinus]